MSWNSAQLNDTSVETAITHFPPYFNTTMIRNSLIPALLLSYLSYRFLKWFFFHKSPVQITHSAWSANVPSKNEALSKMTVVERLKETVPALFGKKAYFRPIPWLRGGHMQTMYCSIGNFNKVDPVEYQRHFLRRTDGGLVTIDISPPLTTHPAKPDENIVVIFHGLTGGSHESYVRALVKELTTNPKTGMRAVVMNFRGCAGTPILTRRLYHAGETNDLRSTLLYLTTTLFPFPTVRYFGVGFSLGANLLTKFCGEEGTNCPFSAAIAIANVWDFLRGSEHIARGTLMNKYVYDGVLGDALRSLLVLHKHAFPEVAPGLPTLPIEEICSNAQTPNITLKIFDDRITGPIFGFKDANDYYVHISSTRFVEGIRIPFLGLNARNDPIVPESSHPHLQVRMSPFTVFATTGGGGHVGWFEWGWRRWFVKPSREFFKSMIEAELETRPLPEAVSTEDGMIRQRGKEEDVGFKVLKEDDLVLIQSGMGKSKLFSGW